MSGFRSSVSRAGPSEVKSVIASVYAGITVVSELSVALTVAELYEGGSPGLSASRIAYPSLPLIITTGIVIGSPFELSALGAPPNKETRMTACAPACWALNAFCEPAQSPSLVAPLNTSTVLPASDPAGRGEQNCASAGVSLPGLAGGSSSRPS